MNSSQLVSAMAAKVSGSTGPGSSSAYYSKNRSTPEGVQIARSRPGVSPTF
jgi:hypothetical protein